MNREKPWLAMYADDIKKEIEVPNMTMSQLLQKRTELYPEHTAISFYGQKMTYRVLEGLANQYALALQQAGVQAGDRVALMLPNCPQFVIAYYGILRIGAIVTQVNPMLVERELEHILNDSGAKTIIVLDDLYPLVKKVQERTEIEQIQVVSLTPTDLQLGQDLLFDQFLQSASGTLNEVSVHPDDVAVLQYTGGTTGISKGAMLTHYSLLANLVQIHEFFKKDTEFGKERILTVIPLFHVYGMTTGMNLAIYMGATNILLPRFELEEVLETIKREQPTLFPGVPTMYIAIVNHPNAEQYQLNSIRICNSGSAPLPVEMIKAFEAKTGAKIYEGFGLSEASPVTHVNPTFGERKVGSIGIGYPSTDYKIVDLATGTKEVRIGEAGEFIIRGPQVMKGYWNMPDETENALRDGWLYTGDIARMDEEGYVYIIDRKKDMIIASGYNVYPRDVEEVLYEHPAVLDAVVVGIPDSYRGETVKAVIVLKPGHQVSEAEMIEFCTKQLATYKVPRVIEFRDDLPRTSVGKILRRAIRQEIK